MRFMAPLEKIWSAFGKWLSATEIDVLMEEENDENINT